MPCHADERAVLEKQAILLNDKELFIVIKLRQGHHLFIVIRVLLRLEAAGMQVLNIPTGFYQHIVDLFEDRDILCLFKIKGRMTLIVLQKITADLHRKLFFVQDAHRPHLMVLEDIIGKKLHHNHVGIEFDQIPSQIKVFTDRRISRDPGINHLIGLAESRIIGIKISLQ